MVADHGVSDSPRPPAWTSPSVRCPPITDSDFALIGSHARRTSPDYIWSNPHRALRILRRPRRHSTQRGLSKLRTKRRRLAGAGRNRTDGFGAICTPERTLTSAGSDSSSQPICAPSQALPIGWPVLPRDQAAQNITPDAARGFRLLGKVTESIG